MVNDTTRLRPLAPGSTHHNDALVDTAIHLCGLESADLAVVVALVTGLIEDGAPVDDEAASARLGALADRLAELVGILPAFGGAQ